MYLSWEEFENTKNFMTDLSNFPEISKFFKSGYPNQWLSVCLLFEVTIMNSEDKNLTLTPVEVKLESRSNFH